MKCPECIREENKCEKCGKPIKNMPPQWDLPTGTYDPPIGTWSNPVGTHKCSHGY